MAPSSDPFVVSLDIGSSSVRALLFDATGTQMEGYGAQLPTKLHTTPDGGAELHPAEFADMTLDCLDELHRQVQASGFRIAAVCGSAFLHGLMGADEQFRPTTPLLHLFDTRSEPFVSRVPNASARTGCPPHASYWPSKLLWTQEVFPARFASTRYWLSFPEFLFAKLFGRPRASISIVSASGLWNQALGDWDPELLAATGVRRDQLASRLDMDLLERELLAEHRKAWPAYEGASWFPLLSDGAANHMGSGCHNSGLMSLMIGTTGALRVVSESAPAKLPAGLWCYRADRTRVIIGGALSNGGEVVAWMKRTLQLPRDIEARLDRSTPGSHGLGMLPFFAGERTPYWRADLKAAITGLTFATEPFDIFRAALESVALGFRQIHELLSVAVGNSSEIVSSGGALLNSSGWTQMIADATGVPITASTVTEASARGAALWALEQCGAINSLSDIPSPFGTTFSPRPEAQAAFAHLAEKRFKLFQQLYGGQA